MKKNHGGNVVCAYTIILFPIRFFKTVIFIFFFPSPNKLSRNEHKSPCVSNLCVAQFRCWQKSSRYRICEQKHAILMLSFSGLFLFCSWLTAISNTFCFKLLTCLKQKATTWSIFIGHANKKLVDFIPTSLRFNLDFLLCLLDLCTIKPNLLNLFVLSVLVFAYTCRKKFFQVLNIRFLSPP